MGVSMVPQNGCFLRENPTKMDGLGVPLFMETTTYGGFLKMGDPQKP